MLHRGPDSHFSQEPALRLISIQLKHKAWRDCLVQTWSSEFKGRLGVRVFDVSSRSQMLLRVLKAVGREMNGVDDSPWAASLGQNISHVNGPLAVLSRLGVVKKVKKQHHARKVGAGRRVCTLKLGQSKTSRRRLARGPREHAAAVAKLAKYVRLADAAHVKHAPTTCKAWVREFGRLDKKFQQFRVFQPRTYMRNWLVRGVLLAALARDGVQRLISPERVSLREIMGCNPDSKAWIARLQVKGHTGSAKAFFQSIGYDGDPALCSMHLCLLLAKAMRRSPAWFRLHRRSLRARMFGHETAFGLMKLPALCVKEETESLGK